MKSKNNEVKVSKALRELINANTVIGDSRIPDDNGKIYYSKVDGSYFTRVGLENDKKFLLDLGITEQIQSLGNGDGSCSCIGFNPISQKWYGWARGIYGFGIGSEILKGHCGFQPSTKEEFIESELEFWGDSNYSVNGVVDFVEKKNGIEITFIYNNLVPNEKLRGTLYKHFSEYPKKYGKGEWKANTLEDAKQMAIDFADSLS